VLQQRLTNDSIMDRVPLDSRYASLPIICIMTGHALSAI